MFLSVYSIMILPVMPVITIPEKSSVSLYYNNTSIFIQLSKFKLMR